MSDEVNAASQQPKLKRLASKPLRLAQNTFNSLSSRSTTPLPSGANTAYSSTVALPDSSSTMLPIAQSGMPRSRIGRRRRHHKLDEQALTPAQIAAAAKAPSKPIDGEEPVAVLRVRVVEAEGLVAKDRSGLSDPFITLVVPPSSRQSTPVIKKSLNPVYPPKDSTFDFPLYLSLASLVGGRGLEGVIWDKDLMRKEYMGEIAVPILDWFDGGDVKLWDDNLPTIKRKILSTRRRQKVSGTVTLQIGFVPPKDVDREEALKKVKRVYGAFAYQAGVPHGMVGVLGVPATEGVGTIKIRSKDAQKEQQSTKSMLRSAANAFSPFGSGHHKMQAVAGPDTTQADPESDDDDESSFEDDGMTSSSSDSDDEDFGEDHFYDSPNLQEISEGVSEVSFAVPEPKASDKGPKSAELLAPSVSNKTLKQPARQSSLPGYFEKKVGSESPSTPGGGTPPEAMTPSTSRSKMPKFRRTKSRTSSALSTKTSRRDFNFDVKHAKEMLGIVIMEIKSAEDLPKLKSSLRVTYDMDPFVVISFGKKVFRTRVIRHSLNPTWDEKMLFHVRRHEANYTTQFTVLDWDKVSGNDMVGSCTLPLSELIADAPKPDPTTGLYGEKVDGKHEMKEFTLPLVVDKDASWEHKYSPKLTIRAKYEPYDALRQRFWRQYMTQYDADDTGKMSYTELTAMLDSLGSTLTKKTLESYFSRCGKSVDKDEMTFDEVVKCFEAEVIKDHSQKEKAVNEKPDELGSASGIATPANGERGESYTVAAQPANAGLDVTGPQGNISSPVDAHELAEQIKNSRPRELQEEDDNTNRPGNQRIASVSSTNIPAVKVRSATIADEAAGDIPQIGGASGVASPSDLSEEDGDISSSPPDDRERIINIRSCPLCHRRRLGKRSEQDIVTHLAICASADWSRVDRIVTANYVTSSQAQRKFFTKLVNKVAIGAYSLGANSANILVQDRLTGQLQEEKMAVYVRLGIRVLYKGAKSRMEGARARKLLKSLSVKQGIKYDSPTSALDIPSFIAFHNLPVNEILDPLDSFKTFNEFFYRKLKPEARPVDAPGDDHRLVSCADCRMMAFETVSEATKIWIKGREFSVGRLLGPNYKDVADRYQGGALGIFRLAPQDYHRFHSPVKGTVGKMTLIDGEYYTVNPQAIRTSLDVYGENVRKVVPVQSEEFGLVMTVWVGAMMVGSILTSVEEGQHVERADELGYFAFGGSTIVCLFEKGALAWDDDLLDNGRASIETLVRMGMGLGRSTKSL